MLAGLDLVARTCPNVTFIATTNHMAGVDAAFLSRADLIEEIGLPAAAAIAAILADTIRESRPARPTTAVLDAWPRNAPPILDARQVRKLVLRTVVSRRELALAPERLPGRRRRRPCPDGRREPAAAGMRAPADRLPSWRGRDAGGETPMPRDALLLAVLLFACVATTNILTPLLPQIRTTST